MKILDFANDEYINLITYRKDGTQVPTPVWLASLDNSLVVTTSLNAGKVKRVRAVSYTHLTLPTIYSV